MPVARWWRRNCLPHRLVAEIAVRVPAAWRFLIWADQVVYGREFRPAPPPRWGA